MLWKTKYFQSSKSHVQSYTNEKSWDGITLNCGSGNKWKRVFLRHLPGSQKIWVQIFSSVTDFFDLGKLLLSSIFHEFSVRESISLPERLHENKYYYREDLTEVGFKFRIENT